MAQHEFEQEFVPAAEVRIEGALRKARGLADLAQRNGHDAAANDFTTRRFEKPLAGHRWLSSRVICLESLVLMRIYISRDIQMSSDISSAETECRAIALLNIG